MISGISQLYHLKSSNPDRAVKEATREFETMFSHQLLKVMSQTVEDSSMGGGVAGDMFNDMLYMEVARAASSGQGIGLATILQEQILAASKGE